MTESANVLRARTTLEVGGEARELVVASTREELLAAASDLTVDRDDWVVLGGGSNVVISDDGVDGTVLVVSTRGIIRVADADAGSEDAGETVLLRVEAGEPWDDLVAHTVGLGLAGLEALSGIPGSTGASPIQNIGAYGAELADTLESVEFVDAETGELARIPADELGFGYRTSIFKEGRRGVIVSVDFRLDVAVDGLSRPIAYPQLASALGVDLGARVPIGDVRSAVLALRASKGMVLDAGDRDTYSAGSFFTNPIVSESAARSMPDDAPRWPADEGRVKLSAAWLIERAGIRRGFALPGSRAGVSTKHTLAITNRGGATASDITELARFIAERVRNEFGVELRPEPNYIGFD
ncbi:UDP-N-acetylmuramate dehydrogenase [Marisediminicola sp. LYQ134]|uniref:UDP-N-acetylmuramate dehydrogenase n=1 Tax=Marisediminicola sp. LYQ134 TaxID=3391061 RepID=UPI0039832045